MNLTLTRFGSTPMGTFGEMWMQNRRVYSVERPWEDNTPFVSCVPYGEYELIWQPTSTLVPDEFEGHTWYLEGETVSAGYTGKPRTRCAIHIANVMQNVNGCIGFGRALSCLNGQWSVAASRGALLDVLKAIGPGNHSLTIKRQG